MSNTLTAPFAIGDMVYHAGTTRKEKQLPCPDCGGSCLLTLLTHEGREIEVKCCSCLYGLDSRGFVTYFDFTPVVRTLTIGSLRYNSHEDRGPWEFMCEETGIGTGSLYYESTVFATREEATAMAATMTTEMRTHIEQENDKRLKRRRGDLRLQDTKDAKIRALIARIRELENAP